MVFLIEDNMQCQLSYKILGWLNRNNMVNNSKREILKLSSILLKSTYKLT